VLSNTDTDLAGALQVRTGVTKPAVSLEELLQEIQSECSRRKDGTVPAEGESYAHPTSRSTDRSGCAVVQKDPVSRLLAGNDPTFVRRAYENVLRRAPDRQGFLHYTELLRAQRLTRAELLWLLRYSAEGIAIGIGLRGLWWRAFRSRLGRQLRQRAVRELVSDALRVLPTIARLAWWEHRRRFLAVSSGAGRPASRYQPEETPAAPGRGFAKAAAGAPGPDTASGPTLESYARRLGAIEDAVSKLTPRLDEQMRLLSRMAFTKADRSSLDRVSERLNACEASLEECQRQIVRLLQTLSPSSPAPRQATAPRR